VFEQDPADARSSEQILTPPRSRVDAAFKANESLVIDVEVTHTRSLDY